MGLEDRIKYLTQRIRRFKLIQHEYELNLKDLDKEIEEAEKELNQLSGEGAKHMKFSQALAAMKEGHKIKLKSWSGYWNIEDGSIKMHCKDGRVLDITESEDIFYTLDNIMSEEWEIADEANSAAVREEFTNKFNFGEALRHLKNGKKIMRDGWNGKDMFVVYQKGYPQGIPSNKQTAEAWGLKEGDLFKVEPYLQIRMTNGSHAMWVPSINDVLASDWRLVEACNSLA